jgi:4-amino-4-deoxy-L-arabinose transferase-like glycosyltransferase
VTLRRPQRTTVLLAAVLLAGFALRLATAAGEHRPVPSLDQRSYVVLGLDLADHGDYGGGQSGLVRPLHWPPGAPAMIAAAAVLAPPSPQERAARDLDAARYLQAIISAVAILAAFGIARRLAGDVAGLTAAAAVAAYPPLIRWSAVLVSEPLGATLLACSMWAVVAAWPQAGAGLRRGSLVAAGVLLGATVLTRADLLPMPFVLAVGLGLAARGAGRRRVLAALGLPLAGAALLLVPWCTAASLRVGRVTPVTTGDAAAFFVGTYLPGGGTTQGLKRALAPEVYRLHPEMRTIPPRDLVGEAVIDAAARRHPHVDQDTSLRREAVANLRRYALGRPLAFAGMVGRKTATLWGVPSRGGGPPYGPPMRVLQPLLVLGCLLATLAAWWRTRDGRLAALLAPPLTVTLVHAVTVTSARYNLPQMPVLLAAGAAAAALLTRRATAPGPVDVSRAAA